MQRRVTATVILLGLTLSAAPVLAASSNEVVLLDGAKFVDSATTQTLQGSLSIGKLRHMTLFSQLADVTNPTLPGLPVSCWFILGSGTDPTSAPSLLGPSGTISRNNGFVYTTGSPGEPMVGDTLVCQAHCAGSCASTLTLKAVLTK